MYLNIGGTMKDTLANEQLEEALISAWVRITATLKNTRITQGMNYNEAIIMLLCYNRFRSDNQGLVSFKEIVSETKMLKSLVNRTIDSLVKKGFLERCPGLDKRTTFVRPVKENMNAYLSVHEQSLMLARSIVNLIGEEDAQAFVRISDKIIAAKLLEEN